MYDDKLEDVTGEDCFFALAEESYLRTETKNYVPQLIAAALLGKAPGKYGITLDSVAPFAYDSVTVPPGTPIAAVAKAIGSSVRDVQALNGQILRGVTPPDASVLLRLPVGSAATFDSAFAALDSTERQAFRRVKPKSNETLAALAKRHDVQVRHVQWYNRKLSVRRGKLTAGQTVLIPNPGVVEGALDVPDPGIERYGTSSGGGSTGRVTHVVRRGETLGGIARKYRTSVATLVRLNRLKRNVIYAGQTIIVRGSSSARTTSSTRAVAKKKVVPKKTTARKPVAKSTTSKAVARKPVAKKPAAKKPVAKKPVARKIVEKPS
jgi:membrane-bound lytic murein transglycosylase D